MYNHSPISLPSNPEISIHILPQELKLFLNRMNNLSTKSRGVLDFLVYPIFKRGLNQVTACEADRWVFSASRADNSSVGRG